MSKKHHDKQLAKTRARREAEKQQVQRRNRGLLVVLGAAVLVAAIIGGNALLTSGDDTPEPVATEAATPSGDASAPVAAASGTPTPAPDAPCPAPDGAPTADLSMQFDAPPPADDVPDVVDAVIQTTCGDITVQLDGAGTPGTVANFVFLAEQGYYVGTPFHRVMSDFVIQGGDPTGTGTGGPGYAIEDELDPVLEFETAPGPCSANPDDECYAYPRGTLAMANSGPDSAGSQFFVVQADPANTWPAAYAAFGMVTDGMDVVDDIANGPVTGDRADQAVNPAVITGIEILDS